METPVSILFVGDMHLGCPVAGLGDVSEVSATNLGPTAAWQRVVELAIARQVDTVALAGDLVHSANALFEAYGILEAGVRRLDQAGIDVCAVAGNHDTQTLPKLAGLLDHFHLLGPGGTWSEHKVGPSVRLVGWSFPTSRYETSPLLHPPPAAESGVQTFGLLHCDLNVTRSPYAPVAAADLRALGYDGWFLGHIHKPDPVPNDGAPFYLGSLTGLDPSETGLHGPVLVTIAPDQAISRTRLALAPLRWDHLTLDCTHLDNVSEDLDMHLLTAVNTHLQRFESELTDVSALGLRIHLQGQVPHPRALDQAIRALHPQRLICSLAGTTAFVQKVTGRYTGQYDLTALATVEDPPGLLARQILILTQSPNNIPGIDDPVTARNALLQQARQTLESVDHQPVFNPLSSSDTPLSEDQVQALLLQAAREALHQLLSTKAAQHALG